MGAFWSAEDKTWFVPSYCDYNQFAKWFINEQAELILENPYYIALNRAACWKCRQPTTMLALASNRYYSLEYVDEDAGDEKAWLKENRFTFLSNVSYLDEASAALVSGTYPFFRLGYSRAAGCSYWANHCQHCQVLQGDFFQHQEPGGAFCPTTIEECQAIRLVKTGGKYDCLASAGVSWSSLDDEILHYSQKL